MRKRISMLLLAASAASAQNAAQIGLGVGLEKTLLQFSSASTAEFATSVGILPVSFTTFSMPILINGKVEFEPEFGYAGFSTSVNESGSSIESSTSILQLGLALSGGKRMENLLYQFGMKAGMARQSTSYETSSPGSTTRKREMSQTNFAIGPIIGVEYFFVPKLSLGARIGINYIFVGEPDESDSSDPGTSGEDIDRSIIGNDGRIDLRWYY